MLAWRDAGENSDIPAKDLLAEAIPGERVWEKLVRYNQNKREKNARKQAP